MIKLIDTINRHLVNLRSKQIQLRKNMDKFTKNQNLDATTKDAFIKAFNQEYTLKKLTQEQQAKTKQKSVYSLDIDEVTSLESSLKEITQLARTQKMETDKQRQERVEKIANDVRAKRESGEAKPMRSTRDKTIVSNDLR